MNYTISGIDLYFSTTIANASLNGNSTRLASFMLSTHGHSLGNIVAGEFTPDVTYIDHWVSSAGKRVKDKTVENVVLPAELQTNVTEFSILIHYSEFGIKVLLPDIGSIHIACTAETVCIIMPIQLFPQFSAPFILSA